MQKKILVGAVGLALVATAVGGTAAYASMDKKVTLSVDGQDRPVSTFDSTVGDVLAAQHITVGPRDVVAPAPTAKISDGTRIAVRFARELKLSVDGKHRSYWVTSTDVSNAFRELGLRFDGAKMSASRSSGIGRAGLTLDVATLKTITVKHDKKSDSVETTALTVGQALSADTVTVDGDDKVSTRLADPISTGDTITVVRVDTRTTKVTGQIAFKTVRKADVTLLKGKTTTERAGVTGTTVTTLSTVYEDGKKFSTKIVSSTNTKAPVDAIVRYGTKTPPAPAPAPAPKPAPSSGGSGGGSGSGLNWGALAQCESGGNPNIVSPNGMYYGLYQFSVATWHAVGGSGVPSQASGSEQTNRAQILYKRSGAGQWPVCGRRLFS
ncbi:MAG TPA: ubiquitin-like domain-containing protein [Actinopolymorphaceae bacterium]